MGGRCELHNQFGFVRYAPNCTDRNELLSFTWEGKEWASVEQGFQAFRHLDAATQESIREMTMLADEANDAYALRIQKAALHGAREDWDIVCVEVLYRAFRAMYASNAKARVDLLATEKLEILHKAEGFWGKWNGPILMRVREELRPEDERDDKLLDDLIRKFHEYVQTASRGTGITETLPDIVQYPSMEEELVGPPKVDLRVSVPDIDQSVVIEAFNSFDANGDGIIDLNDLIEVLQLVDKSWNEEKVGKLMKFIDKDRDGLIGYEEFVAWVFADKGTDYMKKTFCVTFDVDTTARKEVTMEFQRWMLHDRVTPDYTRTSLREFPGLKKYLRASVMNGEIVEIIGKEGEFFHVRLALDSIEGWLAQRYLHPCLEGTTEGGRCTTKDVRRVPLVEAPVDPRLKVVRKFLRKRNRTLRGNEIRAEKIWYLQGHFLGEHGMQEGPKENLFFGCRDGLAEAIADEGFESVWDTVAKGDFGQGVHLNRNSCKAFQSTENFMLICEVAVGAEEDQVKSGIPRDNFNYKEICEERGKLSVRTEIGPKFDHDTFAIYRPSQCKPVYLLKLESPGRYHFGDRLM